MTYTPEEIALAREIARQMSGVQKHDLLALPRRSGFSIPASFYANGLATLRRLFWLFGPRYQVLTPLGKAVVREILRANEHLKDRTDAG